MIQREEQLRLQGTWEIAEQGYVGGGKKVKAVKRAIPITGDKMGMSTNLGTIKGISTDGLGVNSKGQVAMAVSYDQGQAGTSQLTLVLLNPTGQ